MFIRRVDQRDGYATRVYTHTVTVGEDGLTTIATIERATLSTANDIMTVSPHLCTPALIPVPPADGLLGGGHSN